MWALLAALVLALSVAACGSDSGGEGSAGGGDRPGDGKPVVRLGTKNFTEQFILGEIYSQALEAAGFKVNKQLNLGSELIAYKALQNGKVDAYPEYTGTALTSFFGVKTADVPRDAEKAYEDTKKGFAEKDITALAPTPFENTYRLGMTKKKAEEIGNPTKISDLSDKASDLSISGFPECKQRQDCLLGVQDAYGLKFKKFVTSEQKYQVLDSGDADVAFIFTTDGDLAGGKYAILDDDKKFFPPYNVTFNVRNAGPTPVSDISINSATLRGISTSDHLPLKIGKLAPGASKLASRKFSGVPSGSAIFIVNGTSTAPINGATLPDNSVAQFAITAPVNGPSAEVRGIELGVQHMFGDTGFGFQANATLVGTNKPYDPLDLTVSGFAVTGLANSANLVAFYDKDGFQARIAANWRDDYLDHFGQQQNNSMFGSEPSFVNATTQIDFSTSYYFTPRFSVYFSGLNLNGATYSTHGRFSEQLLDMVDYGRRFTLGIHFRY